MNDLHISSRFVNVCAEDQDLVGILHFSPMPTKQYWIERSAPPTPRCACDWATVVPASVLRRTSSALSRLCPA
jgi:hypothetical protein